MLSDELPGQIERLVDHLRRNKDNQISLTDVASVTEVLIGTMQAYFGSIDTSIYTECKSLSEYIANARSEIASLQPGEETEDTGIPRAGLELDAIVQATEDATNTIMNAAEEIMGADLASEDGQAGVQDAVMRIFEACSFQDITGQRISKVVETLTHIEGRVSELSALLGVSESDILRAKAEEPGKEGDDALLRGPALDGEGIDQSAVDDLMNNEADTAQAEEVDEAPAEEEVPEVVEEAPEVAAAPEAAEEALEASPVVKKKKKAAPSSLVNEGAEVEGVTEEAQPEPEPAPEPEPKKEEAKDDTSMKKGATTSQEDIDALFS